MQNDTVLQCVISNCTTQGSSVALLNDLFACPTVEWTERRLTWQEGEKWGQLEDCVFQSVSPLGVKPCSVCLHNLVNKFLTVPQHIVQLTETDEYFLSLFLIEARRRDVWQISGTPPTKGKEIGKGAMGQVYEGRLTR